MYGGSMRQAGILAAAGCYALAHHYDRLEKDHENARELAQALAPIPGVRVVQPVETNIVLFDLASELPDAATLSAALQSRGVLVSAFGPRRIRLVTHLDVDRAACQQAAEQIRAILQSGRAA
jgi:threonine aldolase